MAIKTPIWIKEGISKREYIDNKTHSFLKSQGGKEYADGYRVVEDDESLRAFNKCIKGIIQSERQRKG